MDILIALVERAGEVVTKPELFALVWPGTFVEESNLRVQIAVLRKALGDGHKGVRYILDDVGAVRSGLLELGVTRADVDMIWAALVLSRHITPIAKLVSTGVIMDEWGVSYWE